MFFALWFKLNSTIFFIGIALFLLLASAKNRSPIFLIPIILIIFVYFLANTLQEIALKLIVGDTSLSGTPLISWLAMGLQDCDKAPGWYNGFGWEVWEDNQGDSRAISAASAEVVRDRLSHFSSDTTYAFWFFTKKVLTQWCEPTFQSLWATFAIIADVSMDSLQENYVVNAALLSAFQHGPVRTVYEIYCDASQSLVYIFATVGLYYQLKHRNFSSFLLAIVFLGGFVYFLLFEAKAMYVLPYFVVLIPFAAIGANNVAEHIKLRRVKL